MFETFETNPELSPDQFLDVVRYRDERLEERPELLSRGDQSGLIAKLLVKSCSTQERMVDQSVRFSGWSVVKGKSR